MKLAPYRAGGAGRGCHGASFVSTLCSAPCIDAHVAPLETSVDDSRVSDDDDGESEGDRSDDGDDESEGDDDNYDEGDAGAAEGDVEDD